jgi:hypothetical protein
MANQDKTIARTIRITEAVSSRARITNRVGLIPNILRTVVHRVSFTSWNLTRRCARNGMLTTGASSRREVGMAARDAFRGIYTI